MFDSGGPPKRFVRSEVLGRVAVWAAIGTGVGFGTCGLAVLGGGSSSLENLALFGAGLFFVSLLTLIICGILGLILLAGNR